MGSDTLEEDAMELEDCALKSCADEDCALDACADEDCAGDEAGTVSANETDRRSRTPSNKDFFRTQ